MYKLNKPSKLININSMYLLHVSHIMPYNKNVCNTHQMTPDKCIEYFDVIPGLANYVTEK